MSRLSASVCAAAVLCGATFCSASAHDARDAGGAARPLARYVPVLPVGDTPPSIPMLDQAGRDVSWRAWRGQTLIVGFIYTRCKDAGICPLVAAKFATMQRQIAGTPLHLVVITLDPVHDRPAVLARYGRAFGADRGRWSLVSGEPAALQEVVERFGIVAGREATTTASHSEGVVIIGSDGRIADRIDGNAWSPQEAVALARSRAALPSDGWARTRLALAAGVGALCGAGASGISLGAALVLMCALLAVGVAIAFRFTRDVIRRDAG